MIVQNMKKNPMKFGDTLIQPGKTGELKPPFSEGHALVEQFLSEGWLKKTDIADDVEDIKADEAIADGIEDIKADGAVAGIDKDSDSKDTDDTKIEPGELKPINEMSRPELRTELTAAGVSHANNATDDTLRGLVVELRG